MNEGILTEYAYIIHLPFEHVNILQYMCFVCIMPVLYKPMNGIFLHKPYESTSIFLQMAGMWMFLTKYAYLILGIIQILTSIIV